MQALPATLAIAALTLITVSCGNTNVAQIRIINAISDSQPVDIHFNNVTIAASLPFGGVYPPPTASTHYVTVTSGIQNVDGFPPGDTTNPISPVGILSLNGSTQYTIIAVGLELSEAPPVAIVDNNTVPTGNNLEYRVINASLNSPTKGVDVYFVPPGASITNFTPQISNLGYEQSETAELAAVPTGFSVIVTTSGGKSALLTVSSTAQAGSITTIVLLDNVGGNNGISQTPLVLNDLN